MSITAAIKKMKNIGPPVPVTAQTTVAASKSKTGILMSIHLAHIWGRCSVSGSLTETIANVARKVTTADNTASYSCVATPAQASKKHKTGDVIKAIAGLMMARITKIIKINISIVSIS
jgi:nicotinamide mononucleotide (NMN) deamidase PncC